MASTTTSLTVRIFPSRCVLNANTNPPTKQAAAAALPGRRQLISLVTATTVLKVLDMPSKAADIGLFGLRKKLKKVEEEAEELVKEGFEAADKGIAAAEKGIEAAEKGLVTAEKGIEAAEEKIESTVSFGGLAQAGAVAGAEFVGVLVAGAVVNGILGPEPQKS
uniref:Putative synechocystis YCF37-like n=1 Tax=Solanum chacoense TaxID=4108 RepID=A0A0V0GZU0_SOLCH